MRPCDTVARPILYLISIEDVVRSPLVRSQVFSTLEKIALQDPGRPLVVVSLYPIVNWVRFRGEVKRLRIELDCNGIALHTVPLLFLTRHFYVPFLLFPIYFAQALFAALWIGLVLRPAIMHCRSYPAAVVGKLAKRFCRNRLVFDTRALYPEEGATLREGQKAVMLGRPSFRIWKIAERSLVAASDAVTVVSRPCLDILVSQYPDAAGRLWVIPTTTSVHSLGHLHQWREQFRRELGLSDETVVAYVGSWFEPTPAVELFRKLVTALPGVRWHFMLLVSARALSEGVRSNEGLSALVRRELGLGTDCTAMSVPHPLVARYLACADLAAQPVGALDPIRRDQRYQLTARTRLSVKFTEYLASGLPVVISRWAGAAAGIVQEHDLGLVYDEVTQDDMVAWLARWRAERAEFHKRAWTYARDHFSIDVIAHRYLDLYQLLL